ncbi:MAG: NAD-dependent epimerase/dehydratase family protein, partial [Gemmatimonadetes bacterium]|nr:NAD-dependent epimerase/dehydratase family protein [Gemmatimonadota bacterium]
DLEERLSDPSPAASDALARCPGDVIVLGAGGKMGPSLTRMVRRAADTVDPPRRVIAVSRFSSAAAANELASHGVEVIRADLADPDAWASLPDAPNVVYMVGQKFGTQGFPERTWHVNTAVAAFAAARYRHARIVAFSTGNVYPLVPAPGRGSRESDPTQPVGEYAQSCLGRERAFEYAASTWGTRVALFRLNYAVDLRYGVLVDLALRVRQRQPIDLAMGWFNCIWQGDANALAIASLGDATAPATTSNCTGPATLSVRATATALGERLGVPVTFTETEQPTALLSDASSLLARHGPLRVPEDTLIDWVARWVEQGGATSGKPTHFEQREGQF